MGYSWPIQGLALASLGEKIDLQADVNYEIKNINAISFQSSAHKGKIKNKQKAFRCHLDRQIEQQFSPPLPYKVKINSKLIEL